MCPGGLRENEVPDDGGWRVISNLERKALPAVVAIELKLTAGETSSEASPSGTTGRRHGHVRRLTTAADSVKSGSEAAPGAQRWKGSGTVTGRDDCEQGEGGYFNSEAEWRELRRHYFVVEDAVSCFDHWKDCGFPSCEGIRQMLRDVDNATPLDYGAAWQGDTEAVPSSKTTKRANARENEDIGPKKAFPRADGSPREGGVVGVGEGFLYRKTSEGVHRRRTGKAVSNRCEAGDSIKHSESFENCCR